MAIIKADRQLEDIVFTFDAAGAVIGVKIQVNYALQDDVTGEQETRVRKVLDIWPSLSQAQRTAIKTMGQRFQVLAAQA